MMSINRSIDFINIIFHFSFVVNFCNSENISVSITLNKKTADFIYLRGALFKYCFVSTFK